MWHKIILFNLKYLVNASKTRIQFMQFDKHRITRQDFESCFHSSTEALCSFVQLQSPIFPRMA